MEFGTGAVSISGGLFAPKRQSLSLTVCQHAALRSCAHAPLCGLQTAFLRVWASSEPWCRSFLQFLLLDGHPSWPGPFPSTQRSPVFFGVLGATWHGSFLAYGRVECGLLRPGEMWHVLGSAVRVHLAGRAVLGWGGASRVPFLLGDGASL